MEIDNENIVHRDLDTTERISNGASPEPEAGSAPDYFVERDGIRFAGMHLLIDMWGADALDNESVIREALTQATEACGATLLHIHLHQFLESGGISGVAVLAESHISIHTWPERGFAAIDIFMCGACDAHRAIPVLKTYFQPRDMRVDEQRRGLTE
jgi:S-adenosylmethionine decarboxylase